MTDPIVTHTSVVTEDQIDHLGHINVRYYAENARRGTRAVLRSIGVARTSELLITDTYTRHYHEQLLGSGLEVRSGVVDGDEASVRIYHELANARDEARLHSGLAPR